MLRTVINDEVFAGRLLQRDGRYTLSDGWEPELVDALHELQD